MFLLYAINFIQYEYLARIKGKIFNPFLNAVSSWSEILRLGNHSHKSSITWATFFCHLCASLCYFWLFNQSENLYEMQPVKNAILIRCWWLVSLGIRRHHLHCWQVLSRIILISVWSHVFLLGVSFTGNSHVESWINTSSWKWASQMLDVYSCAMTPDGEA